MKALSSTPRCISLCTCLFLFYVNSLGGGGITKRERENDGNFFFILFFGVSLIVRAELSQLREEFQTRLCDARMYNTSLTVADAVEVDQSSR